MVGAFEPQTLKTASRERHYSFRNPARFLARNPEILKLGREPPESHRPRQAFRFSRLARPRRSRLAPCRAAPASRRRCPSFERRRRIERRTRSSEPPIRPVSSPSPHTYSVTAPCRNAARGETFLRH